MNTTQNPYIGPRTFLKEERHLFFGRDREARDLSALVLSEKLMLFYAQSGAGKSSLINTRLIPELEENLYEVFPLARVSGEAPVEFSPENIYVYNVMRSLIRRDMELEHLAHLTLSQFLDRLNEEENGYFYDESLTAPIRTNPEIVPWRHALIIDQFEELFSTNMDAWQKREDFFSQLAQAMQADPYLWVILIMREDYIAALDPYAHLLPGGLRVRYYMQRLSREAATKAVRSPVENLRPFAAGIAENLIDNLASIKVQKPGGEQGVQAGQYVEPVQLQVVCHSLWENLTPGGTEITDKDLLEVGDVNESLERYYDQRVSTVAAAKNIPERLIREWFDRELITSAGTRNMVLRSQDDGAGLRDDVIQTLQGDLVRAEVRAGQMWYELSHDRLIEPIRHSNTKWFEKNLSLFQRQAGMWIQRGHSEGLLLRGEELERAEEEIKTLALTSSEQAYLDSCRALRSREQRDRRQRRTIVVALIIAVLLFLVAVVASYQAAAARNVALSNEAIAQNNFNLASTARAKALDAQNAAIASYNDALTQRANAEEAANDALAGSLAAQAESLKNGDHALALLLGLEAYQRKPDILTRTTLFQLLQFTPYTRVFGFNGQVSSIAASPEGQWLAVASSNQISVLDADTYQIVFTTSEGLGSVNGLAFNNDGTLLAAGGCVPEGCESRGQITLWDMHNPKKPLLLRDVPNEHTQQIAGLAFSPDGIILASGSYDGKIVLWDVSKPDGPRPIGNPMRDPNSRALITSLAFSLDGKALASAGDDASIRLWDVSTPSAVRLIGMAPAQHTGIINSVAFGPLESRKFASASDDNTVVLWEWDPVSQSLANPLKLEGHSGSVRSVAFNADGTVLASASFDRTVILWDVQTGARIGSALAVHSKAINTAVFGKAAEQNVLFSGSSDETVILWDLTTRQPLSQPIEQTLPPAEVGQTAKSGEVEATVEGQQIRLTGRSEPLTGHTGNVNSLSFSPQKVEGKLLLASASDDQSVILWDVSNVSEADVFLKLEGFDNPVTSAFFSADGKQLTTIEKNGHTTRWIIDPLEWVSLACKAVQSNLMASQWMLFTQSLSGQPPMETCVTQP